ncbi:MAG: glycosyltransferase family 4 protein [Gallionella sp.]|nr:glycosyltransferase family 4 protein [Gallionella sp.]
MMHYAPLIAALVALVSIIILSKAIGSRIQDIPNARSLHVTPVPRIGGIGLMAGLFSGWLAMAQAPVWWVVLPMLILFIVSLFDDMRGLPVRLRLAAHLLSAALLVAGSGFFAQYGVLLAIALWLFTVWLTNLYNFMDGSDGLAGGMAVSGFACYGVASVLAQNEVMALLNFVVAAAAAGFLLRNFPPAKVFMGDAGSIPLGFLAAAMGLWGWQQDLWGGWFPLLVFSPFIVDASVTLMKRSLRGVKITEAHREHYYQRAIRLGWSHRRVVLIEYVLMAGAGSGALWSLQREEVLFFIVPVWLAVYIMLMRWLDKRWLARTDE